MTLNTIFESDVLAAEGELPVTFVFGGNSYQGQKSPLADSLRMIDDGYSQEYNFNLVVRLSVFGSNAKPVSKDQIVIAGITYTVEKIDRSPEGLIVTYELHQTV